MRLREHECPSCKGKEVRVLERRKSVNKGQGSTWRKVECKKCGDVFVITTIYD